MEFQEDIDKKNNKGWRKEMEGKERLEVRGGKERKKEERNG